MLWTALLLIAGSVRLCACDVCGCSVSGGGIGLLANFGQNRVGLQWSHTAFEVLPSFGPAYADHFQTIELFTRVRVAPRWTLTAFQPYRFHYRRDAELPLALDGLGDTRVLLGYMAIKNKTLANGGQLNAELRAGGQLPIGAYDPDILDRDLPENFNTGRGAWSGLLQGSVTYSKGRWGGSSELNYQWYGPSSDDFRYGAEASAALMAFREVRLGAGIEAFPFVGTTFEWVGDNTLPNGRDAHGSGGVGVFGMIGAQVQWKQLLLSGAYQLPLAGEYSDGEVEAFGRVQVQVAVLF